MEFWNAVLDIFGARWIADVFVRFNSNRLWLFNMYLHAYSLSLISIWLNVQHVTKDILDKTVVTLVLLRIMVRSVRQRATVLITSIVITYMDVHNHKVNVTKWWPFPFSTYYNDLTYIRGHENHSFKDTLPIIPAIHVQI